MSLSGQYQPIDENHPYIKHITDPYIRDFLVKDLCRHRIPYDQAQVDRINSIRGDISDRTQWDKLPKTLLLCHGRNHPHDGLSNKSLYVECVTVSLDDGFSDADLMLNLQEVSLVGLLPANHFNLIIMHNGDCDRTITRSHCTINDIHNRINKTFFENIEYVANRDRCLCIMNSHKYVARAYAKNLDQDTKEYVSDAACKLQIGIERVIKKLDLSVELTGSQLNAVGKIFPDYADNESTIILYSKGYDFGT